LAALLGKRLQRSTTGKNSKVDQNTSFLSLHLPPPTQQ